MATLFIITQIKKPKFDINGTAFSNFDSETASEKIYSTYPEAEDAIKLLGKGIYQIQKIFVVEL